MCTVELFEDADYGGALLGTFSTSRAEEAFALPSSVQDAVSSIRLSGACSIMKVWDEDDCEEGSGDNAVYGGDVGELPSDLDNDVCKITLYPTQYVARDGAATIEGVRPLHSNLQTSTFIWLYGIGIFVARTLLAADGRYHCCSLIGEG